MAHTHDDLKKKTVEQLQEIAAGLDEAKVPDYKTLAKDDLVKLLCSALDIKPAADAAGLEKAKIKTQIHALKGKRNQAIEAHDAKQLKWTRLNIKRLKQKIRQVSA